MRSLTDKAPPVKGRNRHPATVAAALRAQAAAILALADALEATTPATVDDDPWVRVVSYVAKAAPARVVNAACAAGQIHGASKRGKSWIARRSAVDAWLASPVETPASDADELVQSWMRRGGGGR